MSHSKLARSSLAPIFDVRDRCIVGVPLHVSVVDAGLTLRQVADQLCHAQEVTTRAKYIRRKVTDGIAAARQVATQCNSGVDLESPMQGSDLGFLLLRLDSNQ